MPAHTITFERPETLDAIFAGEVSSNARAMHTAFGVKATVRDGWIKLEGAEPDFLEKACGLVHELARLHESGHAISQQDFDLLLASASGASPGDAADLFKSRVKVGRRKADIVPRNAAQLHYLRDIKKHDIVFGVGPAGTGKSYLAMAMAVAAYLSGDASRIILTRPAVESGERLGFLPGTLEEKVHPYMRPLYDALYDMLDADEVARLSDRGIVEIAPLAFMRGRTLNNCFIVLDEAQNTTPEQMFMFLTRIGMNSRCVVTGDPTQTDLPPSARSGLSHAIDILSGVAGVAIRFFSTRDIVRSPLIERIILAYSGASRHAPDESSGEG